MWWRELGEVETEYTLHNFSLFAIFLPKIIKIGENLTKFWQKQFCTGFSWHGVCMRLCIICLPVRGTPWWVLLQHSITFGSIFIVECGIARFLCAMRVLEVRHHLHPLGYLCAKFHFCRTRHCWASRWKKSRTQSLTHLVYLMRREPKLVLRNIRYLGRQNFTTEEKEAAVMFCYSRQQDLYTV